MAANLEQLARAAWQLWGDDYAMHTTCQGCGRLDYCRRTRRSRWLCLQCFNQGER